MRKHIEILWLIFKREILPSSDGTGFKQWVTYRLPFFYSPILGIIFLLTLVSYAGLCLIGAEQNLERRLESFRSSSFSALFGKGYFYIPEKSEDGGDNFSNLCRWMEITVDEIPNLSHRSKLPEEKKVFSNVKPFSWIYLNIRIDNGNTQEHLLFQRGMGLPLYGEYADEPLIMEIKDKDGIVKGNFPDRSEEGIIVSVEGMKRFGWQRKEEYPDFLWVKLSSNRSLKEDKDIPLRLCVVKKLPYQFSYILSMKQLNLLKTKYYYDEIRQFELGLINGYSQIILNEAKKSLPLISDISKPYLKGTTDTVRIKLKEPVKRIDILEKILNKDTELFMGSYTYDLKKFKGAIFHLNFEVKENFIWNKEHIYAIQNFMDINRVTVEGELVELLSEMMNTQKNLKKLQYLFRNIPPVIGIILLLFFTVVLHSRMNRLGIKRILGTPDSILVLVYFFMGLFLITVNFFASLFLINYVYNPIGLEVIINSSVFNLFFKIFLYTELGFLIPVLYFLLSFQPSEMIAYKS